MSIVIGVDSSTQSCKVLAVDAENGEIVSAASATHPDGTAIDPRIWSGALRQAWHEAGADNLRGSVAAASVAAQQHGMVALDESNAPVHDALLWNDTRSAPDAVKLRDELGPKAWIDAVNLVPVASFTITKLAWLARTEPKTASSVARVVLPHDWLNFQLGGDFTTDRSDASGTGYFSPVTNSYRTDLLERFFGHRPKLPRIVASNEPAGTIQKGWGADGAPSWVPAEATMRSPRSDLASAQGRSSFPSAHRVLSSPPHMPPPTTPAEPSRDLRTRQATTCPCWRC